MLAHVSTLAAPPPRASSHVSSRVEPRVEREGEPSSWQARAGAGPWAGSRPPRAKRAPTSARASEGGEVWRRRAASEAAQGASEASDRVHPAWRRLAWSRGRPVALPGLGFGSTFRAVSAGRRSAESRVELAPHAPRHETSTARSARRRQRASRPRGSSKGLTSAPDERLRRHRARARPNGSLPRAAADPKTRRTTGRPPCQARRAV